MPKEGIQTSEKNVQTQAPSVAQRTASHPVAQPSAAPAPPVAPPSAPRSAPHRCAVHHPGAHKGGVHPMAPGKAPAAAAVDPEEVHQQVNLWSGLIVQIIQLLTEVFNTIMEQRNDIPEMPEDIKKEAEAKQAFAAANIKAAKKPSGFSLKGIFHWIATLGGLLESKKQDEEEILSKLQHRVAEMEKQGQPIPPNLQVSVAKQQQIVQNTISMQRRVEGIHGSLHRTQKPQGRRRPDAAVSRPTPHTAVSLSSVPHPSSSSSAVPVSSVVVPKLEKGKEKIASPTASVALGRLTVRDCSLDLPVSTNSDVKELGSEVHAPVDVVEQEEVPEMFESTYDLEEDVPVVPEELDLEEEVECECAGLEEHLQDDDDVEEQSHAVVPPIPSLHFSRLNPATSRSTVNADESAVSLATGISALPPVVGPSSSSSDSPSHPRV